MAGAIRSAGSGAARRALQQGRGQRRREVSGNIRLRVLGGGGTVAPCGVRAGVRAGGRVERCRVDYCVCGRVRLVLGKTLVACSAEVLAVGSTSKQH